MNWLEFNRIYINCYNKMVLFLMFVEEKNPQFIFASQMEEFLKEEAQVFAMFAFLQVNSKEVLDDLPVVCEFQNVFLDDIIDLPSERRVEFTIDLETGTTPVSMAP